MTDTNPFTFGSMITNPQRFIGRRAELDIITARLNGIQPQGSAVVGPRRIGKSSLLHYLYRPRKAEEVRPDDKLRVIYFSAAEGSCNTPEQFRVTLVRALLDGLKLNWLTTEGRWLDKLQKRLAVGEPCPWDMARKALEYLPLHPVVCLDEFETLLSDAFDDRFFTALRNWANEGLLTWITASAKPLPELGTSHGRSSPFFNLLATVPLGDLPEDEANQLLALADGTSHSFTPSEQRMVRHLAGTNPYHLQIVCWRLWKDKAAGRQVKKGKLRRFLCDQPSPPAACAKRLVRLARQATDFVQGVIATLGRPLRAIWQRLADLGNVGQVIGGLVLITLIVMTIIIGILHKESLRQIICNLWEQLAGLSK